MIRSNGRAYRKCAIFHPHLKKEKKKKKENKTPRMLMRIRTMANKVLARFSSPSVDRSVQMKYTAVYRYVYETVPYLDVFYHKLEYLSLIESNGRQRFPIAKSNL